MMMTTTEREKEREKSLAQFANQVFSGTGLAAGRLRLQVARIAPHYRIALVIGERGVGKQVIAHELHKRSPVAHLPFVAMELAEFTESKPAGAEGGTVYLRGLERSHPALQEPLLRRLKAMPREVRVVFGCERDLKGMVAAGRLRADVYDAIAMLEIRIAPLRERLDDLEALANSLLRRDGRDAWFAPSAVAVMSRHAWPGNLEELARMCDALGGIEGPVDAHVLPPLEGTPVRTAVRLDEVMQKHVMDVLQRCAGNKLKAAELLGISRSTLYRMLETAVV
jgi:DNA-binding NtrC family response regulator